MPRTKKDDPTITEVLVNEHHGAEFEIRRLPGGMCKVVPVRGGPVPAELSGHFTSTPIALIAIEAYKARTDKRFERGEKEL